ncbi:MAG: hypothetical protein AB8G99_15045 [Planctomycetaceae bacterium]
MKHALLCSIGILLTFCLSDGAAAEETRKVEAGRVSWLRNLEEAKQQSTRTGKPILILFQEIPG